MRKQAIVCVLLLGAALAFAAPVRAQQIEITEMAGLAQISGEAQDNDVPLSMNDMDMVSGGYLLYETEVEANGEEAVLAVENICDYAAVYVGEKRYGELSDTHKELTLALPEGTHKLQLYVENIGRITYGPEILDNTRGLWGVITYADNELDGWTMTPIEVKECAVGELIYEAFKPTEMPGFFKGTFSLDASREVHLNMSGWGMGEVWVNNEFVGTYWENNLQQSIQVPAGNLKEGENTVVVFELKNNGNSSLSLSDKIVFK